MTTADTVLHRPTGETWTVAYVHGDELCPCGMEAHQVSDDPRDALLALPPWDVEREGEFWRFSQSRNRLALWDSWVTLATAILAANEAWLDSQTPTLEELRAKYPGFNFALERVACGPTFCDVAWIVNAYPSDWRRDRLTEWAPTEAEAIERLAKRLAGIEAWQERQESSRSPEGPTGSPEGL